MLISDEYKLTADLVKAFFDQGLYDVVRIHSKDNVVLESTRGISAIGEEIDFNITKTDLQVLRELIDDPRQKIEK